MVDEEQDIICEKEKHKRFAKNFCEAMIKSGLEEKIGTDSLREEVIKFSLNYFGIPAKACYLLSTTDWIRAIQVRFPKLEKKHQKFIVENTSSEIH